MKLACRDYDLVQARNHVLLGYICRKNTSQTHGPYDIIMYSVQLEVAICTGYVFSLGCAIGNAR